jgi:hypothetical protein
MTSGSELLLALFVGMYGSFGLVLRITGSLNDRRDAILGLRSEYARLSAAKRRHLLMADWFPLWIAGLGFVLVAMTVFVALPDIARALVTEETNRVTMWRFLGLSPFRLVSYMSALLAFVGFNALAWGGHADLVLMRAQLRRSDENVVLFARRRVRRKRGAA